MGVRLRTMAPRTLVASTAGLLGLLGLIAAACFVDRPPDGAGGSSGTAASEASTGAGPGSTSAQAGTGTAEATAGSTTGTGETTASAMTVPGTTSTTDPTDSTMTGSICAPADSFPNIDPPECRACLAMNCCVPVSDCAADPACSAAWSCTQTQPCISQWESCPGYAEQKGKLDTISACAEVACSGVCALGLCAAEKAACQQNAECQAVDACVQASCNAACPAENPNCFLLCWAMCQDQHPGGAAQWMAWITCYESKCG